MIFRILLGLVLIAPLALAAFRPWTWGVMACVVALLMMAWGIGVLLGRGRATVGLRRTWPFLLPFTLVAIWVALQALSITPEAWHHPLWRESEALLGVPLAGAVSLNPFATGSALLRLLTYGGIFWLSLQYCRDAERAGLVFRALAVAGLAYAAYGLVIEFTGSETVLWFKKTAYEDNVTSTFINRNSYAAYAGLGLLCATALLIRALAEANGAHLSNRERLRSLLETVTERQWLLLLAWAVLATALLLTDSRGGFASAALGLAALLIAVGATRAIRFRHAVITAVPVIAAGVLFFLYSGDVTAERLARTAIQSEERLQVYALTVQAIEASPLRGTGYGTFEEAFRPYRNEDVHSIYDMAHNSYLENTLELGIPAAALLFLTLAVIFGRCLAGLRRRRRDAIYPCIGVAATVLVAAHALVDFSLQIPAVTASYALLMGAATAQSWRSDDRL